MELESILEKLGHNGKWQLMMFSFIVITLRVPCTWHVVSVALMGYTPTHHCKVPNGKSLSDYIPMDSDGQYLSCIIYTNKSTNQVSSCIDGWEFDFSQSGPTFATKWNLVCSNKYFPSLSQFLFTLGLFFGGFTLIKLVEWFGSRRCYITSSMCLSFTGILTIALDSFKLFLFFRFLSGFCVGATLFCTQKYLRESFSLQSRPLYDLLQLLSWSPGICLCIGLSYLLVDWVHLQIAMDFYILISLPFHIWWLDESVTWLHNKKKWQTLEINVIYIAKINHINLEPLLFPKEDFDAEKNYSQKTTDEFSRETNHSFALVDSNSKNSQSDIENDLSNKELCKLINDEPNERWSLKSCLSYYFVPRQVTFAGILLICNLGFYGILTTSSSNPNHYLSFFLTAFVDFPACLCMGFIIKKYGYKIPTTIALLLATIPMLACAAVVSTKVKYRNYILLACSMTFEFLIGAAYCATFVLLEQAFPSYLREKASVTCTTLGRVGTILASFCLTYIDLNPLAMYVSFAIMSSLIGLLSMFLPNSPTAAPVKGFSLLQDGD